MAKRVILGDTISPIKKVFLPGRLKNLDKQILKYVSTKQVSLDLVEMFRATVNQYIPTDTGAIRDHGYVIRLSNSKKEPWGKLTYRNTKDLPYVMYQYVGKIWQPNYAPFTVVATPDGKISCKWTKQWKAVKNRPRHQTALNFRRKHSARWFKVSTTGLRYKVDFYGYKNKNSQPRWVEYAERTNPDWSSDIKRYAEKVYSDAINQIAANKQRKLLRAKKGTASNEANKVIGIKRAVAKHRITRLKKEE